MGVPQREFSDDEILQRMLFASVNEACKILDEGKALRASDIDVMWLYGFGFPRYRGGLMYWADTIGVREVYNQIAAWHQRYGERWAPSPLLAPPRRSRHPAAGSEGGGRIAIIADQAATKLVMAGLVPAIHEDARRRAAPWATFATYHNRPP